MDLKLVEVARLGATVPIRSQVAAVSSRYAALAGPGNTVVVFDHQGKQVWQSPPLEQKPVAMSFSASGTRLLVTGDQLSNFVLDLDDKTLWRTWHRKTGSRQFLSKDGTMLIREDVRHSVRWLQLASYKLKWLVKGRLLAISPDGTRVLVLPRKGPLKLLGARRGRSFGTLLRPRGRVLAAALGSEGRRAFVATMPEGNSPLLLVLQPGGDAPRATVSLPEEPISLLVMPTVRVLAVRTKSGRWLMLDICTDTPTPLRWNEPERILAVGDGLVLAEVQGAVALYRLERRAACGAPTAKGASQTERD